MRHEGDKGNEQAGAASVVDLVGRLFEDGRRYARAEVELARAQAEATARAYRTPALLAGTAALLVLVALVMAFIAIGAGLASLVGPFGGNALAALIAALGALGLALAARARSPRDG